MSASTAPTPQQSADFGRIVNVRHFDRLVRLARQRNDLSWRPARPRRPLHRSDHPRQRHRALLRSCRKRCSGPILPVLEVESVDEVLRFVNARPRRSASTCSQMILTSPRGFLKPPGPETQPSTIARCSRCCRTFRSAASAVRHGQVPRRVGFPRLHQRARRAPSRHLIDPAVRYPPYSENERLRGLLAQGWAGARR